MRQKMIDWMMWFAMATTIGIFMYGILTAIVKTFQ